MSRHQKIRKEKQACPMSDFICVSNSRETCLCHTILIMRVSRGGGGGGWGARTPKNHKSIGFPSGTGPDPPKIAKLPNQHSMLGHHRPASETPFKWRFAGRPMMARFKWYLDPLTLINEKKNLSKLDPL